MKSWDVTEETNLFYLKMTRLSPHSNKCVTKNSPKSIHRAILIIFRTSYRIIEPIAMIDNHCAMSSVIKIKTDFKTQVKFLIKNINFLKN